MALDIESCALAFPLDFFKLLASCVVVKADGTYGLNTTVESAVNCDCTPVLDCNNTEQIMSLLPLILAVDACGHLAVRLINCDGTMVQNRE